MIVVAYIPVDEDAKPTIEELRALPYIFVPENVGKVSERVYKALDKKCDGLMMLWTSHTYHWRNLTSSAQVHSINAHRAAVRPVCALIIGLFTRIVRSARLIGVQ